MTGEHGVDPLGRQLNLLWGVGSVLAVPECQSGTTAQDPAGEVVAFLARHPAADKITREICERVSEGVQTAAPRYYVGNAAKLYETLKIEQLYPYLLR